MWAKAIAKVRFYHLTSRMQQLLPTCCAVRKAAEQLRLNVDVLAKAVRWVSHQRSFEKSSSNLQVTKKRDS
jgi:hypothetical protein